MKKVLFWIHCHIGIIAITAFMSSVGLFNVIPVICLLIGILCLCTAFSLCDSEYIKKILDDEEDEENGYV